jgi:hypothetical protein
LFASKLGHGPRFSLWIDLQSAPLLPEPPLHFDGLNQRVSLGRTYADYERGLDGFMSTNCLLTSCLLPRNHKVIESYEDSLEKLTSV